MTERLCDAGCGEPPCKRHWPDPTPEMLASPEFEAIWQCIKGWDINVPQVYAGYCGATGNHVRAILDALAALRSQAESEPCPYAIDGCVLENREVGPCLCANPAGQRQDGAEKIVMRAISKATDCQCLIDGECSHEDDCFCEIAAYAAVAALPSGSEASSGVSCPPMNARASKDCAAEAIRTFCKSLGEGTVVKSSDGMERIYYSGLSVDALAVAISLAFSREECPLCPGFSKPCGNTNCPQLTGRSREEQHG